MTMDPRPDRRRRWSLYVLLGAVAVSSAGEAMMVVAVPWFVLQTTGSVAQTGILVALGAVASGAVGFVSGPLVDRWGFRATAVLSYAVGGIGAACIPVMHALDMLNFPTLAALVVAANVLDIPASAAVTGLVPELAEDAGMPLERATRSSAGSIRSPSCADRHWEAPRSPCSASPTCSSSTRWPAWRPRPSSSAG